jgi:hypothetical protein
LNHSLRLRFNLPNEYERVRVPAVNTVAQGQAIGVVIDQTTVVNRDVLARVLSPQI